MERASWEGRYGCQGNVKDKGSALLWGGLTYEVRIVHVVADFDPNVPPFPLIGHKFSKLGYTFTSELIAQEFAVVLEALGFHVESAG